MSREPIPDPTPVAKIVPPVRPAGSLARAALVERISDVLERRLTLVVADAGFGKSSLLVSWWERARCTWYTLDRGDGDLRSLARGLMASLRLHVPQLASDPFGSVVGAWGTDLDQISQADALGSHLAETLRDHVSGDLVVMIDDLQEIETSGPSIRLVEALCRQAPPNVHVVLAGRRQPSFPVQRLRGRGQLILIGADSLAFTLEETRQLIAARLEVYGGALARDLHGATGGWPAAVSLAIEAMRESSSSSWPKVIAGLAERGAPLFTYLAEEVFAPDDGQVRELLRIAALFESFTPELCGHLGVGDARQRLEVLAREGLFVQARHDGSMALQPLVREFAREALPLPAARAAALRLRGADWYAAHGDPSSALAILLEADDPERLARLLVSSGAAMLAAGHVTIVLEACLRVPPDLHGPQLDELEGDARQAQGDWSGALAGFERAGARVEHITVGLAWRIGFIHHQRGDLDGAISAYQRGREDPLGAQADRAMLLAWEASAHWVRSELESCRRLSAAALRAATECGDARALAAAHTAMAMLAALDGDRRANDAHYLSALRAAEEAGDVLQIVRIHANRASHFTEEGSYAQALEELDIAVPLAEVNSLTSYLGLALCNRGEARLHRGRLDEALSDFEDSRAAYERISSDMVAYALTGLGDIHRERGNLAQARAAYEEAVSVSEKSGDVQGLAPALAGLALVTAGQDPDGAEHLAARAIACGTGLGYVAALLAGGWVAAVGNQRSRAAELADQATSVARSRRDRAGLADGLVLAAVSAEDPRDQASKLHEALAIWRQIGDPVGESKAELALSWAQPTGQRSSARRRQAERRLEALGLRVKSGGNVAAGVVARVATHDSVEVSIETLGGFSVLRGGGQVGRAAWQSRRARELLKLLVARRGRPVPRPVLMEALWPHEDPRRVSNRLSVALSTLRAVLDPERRLGADQHITADDDAVALNLANVDVDVERFLTAANDGLDSLRRGETEVGLTLLEFAEVAYAGDFLEENLYDEWAAPVREEARAAYITVARALAGQALRRAEPDAAIRYLLRILEIDRYDEDANLELVGALSLARRHGEAQRHYLAYRRAMDELGIEPMPFPDRGRR